jgi:hypothetical protein
MNLVDRVKKILIQPKQEWKVIVTEPYTVQDIFTRYVMILAAIPAVAGFIGLSLVGIGGFGITYRVPIASGIAYMIIQYVLGLASVYAIAMIIDALAPQFGSEKDFMQSLKVAAFFPTAAWVTGIFNILPALGILALIGALYSLYLLYLGLGELKKTPDEKMVAYTVVVLICAIVLWVVIAAITALAIPGPVRGF